MKNDFSCIQNSRIDLCNFGLMREVSDDIPNMTSNWEIKCPRDILNLRDG